MRLKSSCADKTTSAATAVSGTASASMSNHAAVRLSVPRVRDMRSGLLGFVTDHPHVGHAGAADERALLAVVDQIAVQPGARNGLDHGDRLRRCLISGPACRWRTKYDGGARPGPLCRRRRQG